MDANSTVQENPGRQRLSIVFLAAGIVLLVIALFTGISDNLPGITSMFIGGFAVIMGFAFRFTKSGTRSPWQDLLYWAPRVLCIAFGLFTSLFAFDVFGDGKGLWETALGLFLHLIPTLLIFLLLAISWRREWIGGVLFIVMAILYTVSMWNRPVPSKTVILWMATPLVLVGVLFLLNWHYRAKLRGPAT